MVRDHGQEMSDADVRQLKCLDFIIDTIVALGQGRIDNDQFQSRMDVRCRHRIVRIRGEMTTWNGRRLLLDAGCLS